MLIFALFLPSIWGKITTSTFQLSSDVTEVSLAKFSFSSNSPGFMEANFSVEAKETYFDGAHRHDLMMTMYKEDAYARFQKLLSDGSLCDDRLKAADWRRKIVPGKDDRHFKVMTHVPPNEYRSHYVYFIIMDCTLEWYNAHPPPINFDLKILNHGSHLPADEDGMILVHALLLIVLSLLGLYFVYKIVNRMRQSGQTHLITLIALVALFAQIFSVCFELCHLAKFTTDGKGFRWRWSWVPLDFLSELLQMLAEMLIIFILLSLAAGWTLRIPIKIDPESGAAADDEQKLHGMKKFSIKSLMYALRAPMEVLSGKDIVPAAFFSLIFITQIVLEAYGRKYEEDFASFHDHEHWPGMCLMAMRIALGIIFQLGVFNTLRKDTLEDKNIIDFLKSLRIWGSIYFFSFPILVMASRFLAPYKRHAFVTGVSIASQSMALLAMMRTFATESFYLKISSVGSKKNVADSSRRASTPHPSGSNSASFQPKVARRRKIRKKVAVD